MSLIELHPQLSDVADELRGIRHELSRIADLLGAFITPQLSPKAEYTGKKKGSDAVATTDYQSLWEQENLQNIRVQNGLTPTEIQPTHSPEIQDWTE